MTPEELNEGIPGSQWQSSQDMTGSDWFPGREWFPNDTFNPSDPDEWSHSNIFVEYSEGGGDLAELIADKVLSQHASAASKASVSALTMGKFHATIMYAKPVGTPEGTIQIFPFTMLVDVAPPILMAHSEELFQTAKNNPNEFSWDMFLEEMSVQGGRFFSGNEDSTLNMKLCAIPVMANDPGQSVCSDEIQIAAGEADIVPFSKWVTSDNPDWFLGSEWFPNDTFNPTTPDKWFPASKWIQQGTQEYPSGGEFIPWPSAIPNEWFPNDTFGPGPHIFQIPVLPNPTEEKVLNAVLLEIIDDENPVNSIIFYNQGTGVNNSLAFNITLKRG